MQIQEWKESMVIGFHRWSNTLCPTCARFHWWSNTLCSTLCRISESAMCHEYACRCSDTVHRACSSEMDPAIHSPFTLSGSRRQPAFLLPLPNCGAREKHCSGGRIVSWIIYYWLVWCERKILFPAGNLRSFTSKRTGYGGIKTSSNQQDPSLRLLKQLNLPLPGVSDVPTHGENPFFFQRRWEAEKKK